MKGSAKADAKSQAGKSKTKADAALKGLIDRLDEIESGPNSGVSSSRKATRWT